MGIDIYGVSRVIGQAGTLPQGADRLDSSLPLRAGELLVDVEQLNIDAASFRQLREANGNDAAAIGRAISDIVQQRGKMHNPVTGSGGMLLGTVKDISPLSPHAAKFRSGDRVATLISLTLTPLKIEEVISVNMETDRVAVRGHAILPASATLAHVPPDLPERLSLAALDVCGAPALVARYVAPGMKVLVLGSGKSGALCLAIAKEIVGSDGLVIAADLSESAIATMLRTGLCDRSFIADATHPLEVFDEVSRLTAGTLADVVVNCASVRGTEMASILSARAGGTVIFFSMATSFTAAALGAEGVGKDVQMIMGNGYVPGHADLTLDLLRRHNRLRELFAAKYAAVEYVG